MLNLSEIAFKVNTQELDSAAKKIEALGTAVSELSVDLTKLDKATANAVKAQKEQQKATQDAAKATVKATEDIAKAEAAVAKAKEATKVATENSTKVTKESVSVLERQQTILEFMTQGFSKGQSSTLAYAKATGILNDDLVALQGVLQSQRTLIGGDPFDKSLGALKSLQNEFKVLKEVQRLYTAEIPLTQKQMENLALDKLRLIEAMKIEGKSLTEIKNAIRDLNSDYIGLAGSINRVTAADNAIIKSTKDTAKANEYLDKELQKVRFALEENNKELNRGSSNALVRFENALKKSGLTVDEQKAKLDEYRKAQMALQKAGGDRATDYISRAVGPQITDIVVGLATGQSPLTVMLQQGGQLRDQFALAGVAADDMGKVMKTAMSTMASSVFATGKAITTMLVGGITDAGKAMVNFALDMTRFNVVLEKADNYFLKLGETGQAFSAVLRGIGVAVSFLAGTALLATIGTIIGLGVAFYQVTKENDALAKSLALSGGSLALSQTAALSYVKDLGNLGATTGVATEAIIAMAKAGNIAGKEVLMIGQAASDMQKWAEVPIEETVKQFSKLKEKPVEALLELAKATGMVSPEILRMVIELERQGKASDAAALAMKAYADVTKQQIGLMKENYSEFGSFIINAGDNIKGFFSKVFKSIMIAENPVDVVTKQLEDLNVRIKSIKDFNAKTGRNPNQTVLSDLQSQADALSEILKLRKKSNDVQERASQLNTENASVQTYLNGLHEKYMPSEIKAQNELNVLLEKRTSLLSKGQLTNPNDLKIMDDAIAKQKKIIADANKPKKVHLSDEQKEINKAEEEFIDIQNKSLGISKEFNNQVLRQLLLKEKGLKTEEEYSFVVNTLVQQQKFYTDEIARQNKEIEQQKKLAEALVKIQEENSKFVRKQSEDNDKVSSGYDLQLQLLGKTAEEQKIITDAYALQSKIQATNLSYDERILKVKQDTEALIRQGLNAKDMVKTTKNEEAALVELDKSRKESLDVLYRGVAVNAATAYVEEMRKITATISDIIITALFEGGQAGSKKIRDYLVNLLRQKISLSIDAFINPVVGAANSAVSSAFGNSSSAITTGKGIYDAISGGFASLGASASQQFANFAVSNAGQSLGLSTMQTMGPLTEAGVGSTVATMTESASTMASAAGTIASYAAGAGAGIMLGSAIGGDKVLLGVDAQSASMIGAAIGAVVGGPIGAFIGGTLGGVANAAFGQGPRETNAVGIKGTLGASSGANLQSFQDWSKSGGWFSSGSSGTDTQALNSESQKYFNLTVASITAQTKAFADTLGLGADKIENFTKEININLKDLSQEDQKKAIDAAIKGFGTSMAEVLLGSFELMDVEVQGKLRDIIGSEGDSFTTQRLVYKPSAYIKEGETADVALQRLAASLTVVNAVFKTLDVSLLKTSLSGANAASVLLDAFGGVEKFAEVTSSYYENFYTKQEQLAEKTSNLAAKFTELGLVMPAVDESMRSWYRSEVERQLALDQSVPANAKATASLLGLQGVVNELAPAFDDLKDTVVEISEVTKALNKISEGLIQEGENLQKQWDKTFLSSEEYRKKQIEGLTDLQIAQYDTNRAIEATLATFEKMKQIQAEGKTLQDELNSLTMTASELSKLRRDSLNEENRAIYDQIEIVKKAKTINDQRLSLETQLMEVMGNTAALRDRERSLIDASNLPLYDHIQALKAAKIAQEEYTKAVTDAEQKIKDAKSVVATALSNIEAIQQEATSRYISAQEKVLAAQSNVTNAQAEIARVASDAAQKMFDLGKSLRDFLASVTSSPLQSFAALIKSAMRGDTEAMAALPNAATAAIDQSRTKAKTLEEAILARAKILGQIDTVARIAEASGANAVQKDPAVVAQENLVKSQTDLTKAQGDLAVALSVANSINAPLTQSVTDLIQKYAAAQTAFTKAQADLAKAEKVLEDIKNNTGSTADTIKTILEEGIQAKFELDSVINFIANSNLTDLDKKIATQTTNTLITTLSAVMDSSITDNIKKLVFSGVGIYTATLKAVLDSSIPDGVKSVILDSQKQYSINIGAVLNSSLDDNTKTLLLNSSLSGTKAVTLSAAFSNVLTPDQITALNAVNSNVTRIITQTIVSTPLTETDRTLLAQQSSTVNKLVNQIVNSGALSTTDSLILKQSQETVQKLVNQTVSTGALSQADLTILNQANSTVNKLVTQSVQTKALTNEDYTILGLASTSVSKLVNQTVQTNPLSAADVTLLNQGNEIVNKTINTLVNTSGLTPDQQAILTAVSGSSNGSLTLSGSVQYDPSQAVMSVFNALGQTNNLLVKGLQLQLAQLLGVNFDAQLNAMGGANSIAEGTYKLAADTRNHLGNILNLMQTTGIRIKFDRGVSGPGGAVYADGGAFTNGIVDRPTSFNSSLMGEAGPEAIMPLTNIGGTLGVRTVGSDNKELVEKLAAIEAELSMLRYEARATAINTSKLNTNFERSIVPTAEGEALLTKAAA